MHAPIFTQLSAPTTKSLDIESINKFLRKYEQYKRKVDKRRNQHNEEVYAELMTSCMDTSKLKGIAKYNIKKEFNAVNDEDLLRYFDTIRGSITANAERDEEQII